MNYRDLRAALEILHLGERASLAEIKSRYRNLARQYHPDGHQEPVDPEAIRDLNDAYALIRSYCDNYRYDFSREEFFEQNPEERMRRQFGIDPLWDDGGQTDDEA